MPSLLILRAAIRAESGGEELSFSVASLSRRYNRRLVDFEVSIRRDSFCVRDLWAPLIYFSEASSFSMTLLSSGSRSWGSALLIVITLCCGDAFGTDVRASVLKGPLVADEVAGAGGGEVMLMLVEYWWERGGGWEVCGGGTV